MRVDELDYDLPEALIAQSPLDRRDASRLLVVTTEAGQVADETFRALPSLLPKALFVFNDTRVFPARLRGTKPSGGKVELLLIERLDEVAPDARPGDEVWLSMGRTSKGLRPGLMARFGDALEAEVLRRAEEGRVVVRLRADGGDVMDAVEAAGEMPLPPYIRREVAAADRERYQTVFAREPGAVAAPTAGLHFTEDVLAAIDAAGHERAYVTLHVGPGTFRPVKSETLDEHPMHRERYGVPAETADAIARARREGRPVVAVGTTVVRTLEAAAADTGEVRAGHADTALFIKPPYAFKVVDALLTNFHLPRSTLLALVMALGGKELIRRAYAHAVDSEYRFFSYGDAMLIRKAAP